MAVVEFSRSDIEKLVGKKLSDSDIADKLPMLGAPLEHMEGDLLAYEIFPDRPDMLSAEGFARAARHFLGIEAPGEYRTKPSGITLSAQRVAARPHIGAAVVRGVTLSDAFVRSLMQLQEKLHETLGRKRRKVAIGLHDIARVKPPFEYKAVKPHEISFVPLDAAKAMTLREVCEKHPKGEYCASLKGYEEWPVITDAGGEVLSFPPVINGELTRVTEKTKSIFVDVTGTDAIAVNQALNILCAAFAERGASIETVLVNGRKTPDLAFGKIKAGAGYMNKLLDLDLSAKEIDRELSKMGLRYKSGFAHVPPYRGDVMHAIDIAEDVAIARGYMRFEPRIPAVATIAKRLGAEEFREEIRMLMAGCGLQEAVTMILTNERDEFAKMNNSTENVCETLNPVSRDHSICRKYLLPSLLRVLVANRSAEYPQNIFELGTCVVAAPQEESGARNVAKLAAAMSSSSVNYGQISSLLDAVMRYAGRAYKMKAMEHGSFIAGRCASVIVSGKPAGIIGEIHPKVLNAWRLEKPVVAFELAADALMK